MPNDRTNFFFYGTLRDSAVLSRVSRRRFPATRMRPAVLHGFELKRVAGKDYPAIRPAPGKCVEGRLVYGVDGNAAKRIDMFEDEGYDSQIVHVELPNNRKAEATAFVASRRLPLTDENWDYADWFRRRRLSFLANLKRYLRGVPAEDAV